MTDESQSTPNTFDFGRVNIVSLCQGTLLSITVLQKENKMADEMEVDRDVDKEGTSKPDKMFTLKKWNLVAMWSWDVECDTCAICRVQVMGEFVVQGLL